MLRDPSLIPLSHQHQHGLALCLLTDRSLAGDASPENVSKLASEIVRHFDAEMAGHFHAEEELLFPAIAELPLVARLTGEHRQLENIVGRLRAGGEAADVRAFTSLLRPHIRTEENELFEETQRILSRDQLDEIGRLIDARLKTPPANL